MRALVIGEIVKELLPKESLAAVEGRSRLRSMRLLKINSRTARPIHPPLQSLENPFLLLSSRGG